MEYLDLEGTGIRVSRVGLGTWALGNWMWGGAGDDASMATIRHAIDNGITLIDTAPEYGRGHAEEIICRSLVGRRDEVVLATKGGVVWDETGQLKPAAAPAALERQVDASLRRLRTDRIDVYEVESIDPATPVEKTAEAMLRLFEAGKIRAIAVGELTPPQIAAFRTVAPIHVMRSVYNLFERDAERYALPYAARNGIATFTHGALCRGLLSGLLSGPLDQLIPTGADDVCRITSKRSGYGVFLGAVRGLEAFARERFAKRVAHLALRWVLDRPGAGVALWRARRPDQLNRALEVFDFHLDAEALRDIDRMIYREARNLGEADPFATPSSAAV